MNTNTNKENAMDFAIGDRIELVAMNDDPDPITPGSRGTVDHIGGTFAGLTQIGVAWDSGRSLMVLHPDDVIVKVTA